MRPNTGASLSPPVSGAGPIGADEVVTIRVFGGLRVWRGTQELTLGPPRRQAVLALLLAARGQSVAAATLIDVIWQDGLASTATNQLQRHIGDIRRLFEPDLPARAAGTWLLGTPNGYRLDTAKAACDLTDFTTLLHRARAANDRTSGSLFEAALRLAAAAPFAGLGVSLSDLTPIGGLRRERIEAAVQCGSSFDEDHRPSAAVLAVLAEVAAGEPLNEPLQAAWINALVAAGRRAEALTHFDHIRRRLDDELGVDPGHAMRAAFQRALAEPGGAPFSPTTTRVIRPAQLPPRVLGFIPRAGGPGLMHEYQAGDSASGRAVVITAISGMAGIGKTALAIDWAHQLSERYPDGQLYLNLRGFDPSSPPLDPGAALNVLLESLGANLQQVGESLEARIGGLRSLLADRRMLIVLDNARDSEQVIPLIPGAAGCQVIVTSRNQLTGLVVQHNAYSVQLDRLSDDEARDLLSRRLGQHRVSTEPAVVDELITRCAGLPLALAIVAARASLNRAQPLESIADELAASAHTVVGALSTGETSVDVRSAFSWSYRALSPGAAQLFRLSAVHPGPDLSVGALAAVADQTVASTRQLLVELASTSMVTRLPADWCAMHDLLRVYAAELLDRDPDERREAERRLVSYYQVSARNAFLATGRPPFNQLDAGGNTPGALIERIDRAMEWYVRERAVIDAVARLALARGWVQAGITLILDVRPMSTDRDLAADFVPLLRLAADAAQRTGDWRLEGETQRMLGLLQWGDPQDREEHLNAAAAIFEREGDMVGQANVLRNRAVLALASGHPLRSAELSRSSITAAQQAGRRDLMASGMEYLGNSLNHLGQYGDAVRALEQALALIEESGAVYLKLFAAADLAASLANLQEWERVREVARWGLSLGGQADPAGQMQLAACLCRAAWENGDREESLRAAGAYLTLRATLTDAHIITIWGSSILAIDSSNVGVLATDRFIADQLHL